MQRPQDPYDYTRVDSWFRQAVDPKVFTVRRPPFLGEVNFREEFQTANRMFEHRYYYLDGVLIGHIVVALSDGRPTSSILYQLDSADEPHRFSGDTMAQVNEDLLRILRAKSIKPIHSVVPNRTVSLSSLVHP